MTYRILVTGSRTWWDYAELTRRLSDAVEECGGPGNVIIVHGGARGADAMAQQYADACAIWTRRHPAAWYAPCRPECDHGPRRKDRAGITYCPAAGKYRNEAMVQHGADLCLAFLMPCTKKNCDEPQPHDSHGSAHCADLAENADIETRRYPL